MVGWSQAADSRVDWPASFGDWLTRRAFSWTRTSGTRDLGTLGIATEAVATSVSGGVVVGKYFTLWSLARGFYWTSEQGLREIDFGSGYASAADVSADGSIIVGHSWGDLGYGYYAYGYHWTRSRGVAGFIRIDPPPGYLLCAASAVSPGGDVVVGVVAKGSWWYQSRAWIWSAKGGLVVLDSLPGWDAAAYGVSCEGSAVIGVLLNGDPERNSYRAFLWRADTGMRDIGTLGGQRTWVGRAITAKGDRIFGASQNAAGEWRAFRWTERTGMLDLNYLYASAIPSGWVLRAVLDCSSDGRYLVGWAEGPGGVIRGFLLDTRQEYVPSPPTNLRAFALSSTQIQLDWKDNSMGEQGFEIERKGESGDYTVIARVGANVTTYTDGGLTRDTTYTYRVRAYNAAGKSPYSNPASATTCSGNGLLHEERCFYRANLHSHSSYSDGRWSLTFEGDLPPVWVFTWAYNMKWNIWAVTDHAEQLSEQEWQKTEQDALTSMSWFPTFAALRGFEWTGYTDDMLNPFDTPVDIGGGHINVFGSDRRKGAYEASDKKKYPIEPFDVLPDLLSLYDWLANTPATDRGTLVAQFNHPTTYDESSHFWRFWAPGFLGLDAPLVKVFALMEMGSYTAPWQSFSYEGGEENLITGVARDDQARSNEYWFRVALFQGWHVAPANNRDNHLYKPGLLGEPPGPPAFTGIWTPSFGDGEYLPQQRTSMILDSLRSRRVFASEDWNTQLTFQARIKRGNTVQQGWYWMGSTFEIPADANAVEAEIRIVKDDSTPHDCVAVVELFISPPWDCAEPDSKYLTYRWIRSYAPVSAPMTQLVEARFTIPIAQLRRQSRNALGEVYMYVRVRTSSGRLLYSAPIWIRGVPADMSSPLDKEPL